MTGELVFCTYQHQQMKCEERNPGNIHIKGLRHMAPVKPSKPSLTIQTAIAEHSITMGKDELILPEFQAHKFVSMTKWFWFQAT